jgi:hypothetical protein
MKNLFLSVILSDESGRRGDRTRSRRNPMVASYRGLVVVPGGGDLAFSQV